MGEPEGFGAAAEIARSLRDQLYSGWSKLATGSWRRDGVDVALVLWWTLAISLDGLTTAFLLAEGQGSEGNPGAALLFHLLGTELGIVLGSAICCLFALFSLGDHDPKETYILLTPPLLILVLKTIAVANNSFHILL